MPLNRHLAPMSDRAWQKLEDEATEVLELHLAARRIVDFEGPLGWEYSAADLGDVRDLGEATTQGVRLRQRIVRPLIELRAACEVERSQLERIDRGAPSVDLDGLRDAARKFAAAEDHALFNGCASAGIPGLSTHATHRPIALPEDAVHLPDAISDGLDVLRRAGVAGPYALALGAEAYAELDRSASDGGYPVLRHVQKLLDSSIVWAPRLAGGLLTSLRGGDFRMICGRDISLGYLDHDEKHVRIYLEESFTFELDTPEAIVPFEAPRSASQNGA